jgi:hypothetical protein
MRFFDWIEAVYNILVFCARMQFSLILTPNHDPNPILSIFCRETWALMQLVNLWWPTNASITAPAYILQSALPPLL